MNFFSRTEKLKAYAEVQSAEMIILKMRWFFAALIILFLAVAPALGEMTEYQRGVANGLKVGLFMGEYYGRGQYVVDYAGQYNTYLDMYNQFLWSSFSTNQTLMNEFMRNPIAVAPKQSSDGGPLPDASGRIFGYPADSYYTWVGAVPGTVPQNPGAALPGV
jgi:hypothetical protein